MILWREVKKAILNPPRTDFTETRAPALLVNNNRVGLLTECAGFAEEASDFVAFISYYEPRGRQSHSSGLEKHWEKGNSIKQ